MRHTLISSIVVVLSLTGRARADDPIVVDRARVVSQISDALEDLARVEGAAERCGDVRTKVAEIRGRLKALRDDLKRASGPGGDPVRHPVDPVRPPDPPDGPAAIDDGAFAKLLKRVDGETFADAKLRVIREAAASNYFRAGQIAKLLPAITMSSDRLKALDSLASHLLDVENAFVIYKAFDFEADKKKAEQILKRVH